MQRPLVPNVSFGDEAPLFPGVGGMRHSTPLGEGPKLKGSLPYEKLQVSCSEERRSFSALPALITHG